MSAPGPYTVTVTHRPEHDGATGYVFYREAFATLELVRDWLYEHVDIGETSVDDLPNFARAVDHLPETGGTITLPNGDVIEVEATTYTRLAEDANRPHLLKRGGGDHIKADILAAWNAEHGIGVAPSAEPSCPACGSPRSEHVGPPAPPLIKGHLGAKESRPGSCLLRGGRVAEHGIGIGADREVRPSCPGCGHVIPWPFVPDAKVAEGKGAKCPACGEPWRWTVRDGRVVLGSASLEEPEPGIGLEEQA